MFEIPVGNRFIRSQGVTPAGSSSYSCFLLLDALPPSSKQRDLLMDPPSYEEVRLNPPVQGIQTIRSPPPPTYNAFLASPPTPPPAYRESVTFPQSHVLAPYSVATVQPVHQHTNGNIIHPVTRVGGRQAPLSTQSHPPVVVTQPRAVPIEVSCLSDSPALIRCPHCHHTVTTKVRFVPGDSAWCMCILLALMGLFCGFCLIPLMVRSMQDAHHSCPRCGNHVHVYKR